MYGRYEGKIAEKREKELKGNCEPKGKIDVKN
jgi:hypothetical protein